MKFKERIKEKAVKTKNWIIEHKKAVIGGVIGTVCVGLVVKHAASNKSNDADIYVDDFDPIDYGRDMRMQFIYEDTGELMEGSVPCTELYAKECIEMMDEN